MRALLEAAGVTPQTLSVAGRSTLHSLAHAAVALQCPQGDFLQAVLCMQDRAHALQSERDTLAAQRAELLARSDEVERMRNETLETAAGAKGEAAARLRSAEKQGQQLDYYAKKRAEYDSLLEQCETHLASVKFDPAIRHVECERLFGQLKKVEQECAVLEEELAQFGDLEPTLEAAQAKLEVARADLAKLKAKYSQALAQIASKVGGE